MGPRVCSRDLMANSKLRLAIVGCGAITENSHLPAILSSSLVDLVAICDANETRLRYLRRQFALRSAIATSDYRELFGVVDAVVLALPNHLHGGVGCEFLSRGIHVLCEKPLAVSRDECEQLCNAARDGNSVLTVGYHTRFYPSTELTRELIHNGFLGRISSFDYEFGTAGGWETLSGYNLSRKDSGGGVLVVSGSHFLDRMFYFFDSAAVTSYEDDGRGGVEANCIATFECTVGENVVTGRVSLSRTHKLSNRTRIVGQRGVLEIGEGQSHSVTFYPAKSCVRHELSYFDNEQRPNGENIFQVELEDFVSAIKNGRQPRVDAGQGAILAAIFERCYKTATALDEPWVDATMLRLRAALPGEARAGHPES
jgi:predicted dehydrogenase